MSPAAATAVTAVIVLIPSVVLGIVVAISRDDERDAHAKRVRHGQADKNSEPEYDQWQVVGMPISLGGIGLALVLFIASVWTAVFV